MELNTFSYLVVFLIVEGIVLKFKYSPGYRILSIYAVDSSELNLEIDSRQQKIMIVDSEIKQGESWLTMIMGTLLINSGVKGMERMMVGQPVAPMFGLEFESLPLYVTSILFGVILVILGILVLKLKREAFILCIICTVVGFFGALMSFDDFHLAIEAKQKWREAHGAPPRKIDDLQNIIIWVKNVVYVMTALNIALLLVIKKRLIFGIFDKKE